VGEDVGFDPADPAAAQPYLSRLGVMGRSSTQWSAQQLQKRKCNSMQSRRENGG